MKDMQVHLEKLRADAAECALIRDLATEPTKRALFTRLAVHLENSRDGSGKSYGRDLKKQGP